MSEFLVEVYVSRAAALLMPGHDEVCRVAGELTSGGTPVRLLGSLFVPEDETYLYLFEAASSEAAHAAATRSGLQPARVVQAMSDPSPSVCSGP
jgi:hypothetical protein